MTTARINAFERILTTIVKRITDKFPKDRDVFNAATQIDLSLSLSKRKTIATLVESFRPFKTELLNRDVKFFLDLGTSGEGLASLDLGHRWSQFTKEEQDQLFTDAITLYNLSERLMNEL